MKPVFLAMCLFCLSIASAHAQVTCSQLPALTGDVTTSAGSCATALSNTTTARSHLGLGSLATQNSGSVSIGGGSINATIGTSGSPAPAGTFQGLASYPANGLNNPIIATGTQTGSPTTNFNTNLLTCYDQISFGSNSLAENCLTINNVLSGSSESGNSTGLNVFTNQTTTSAVNSGYFYLGLADLAELSANDNGVGTTLSATAGTGATSISVANITGISSGDGLVIPLDNGQHFGTSVNGTPSGGTIVLTNSLPSQASSGNAVYDYKGETQGIYSEGEINGSATLANNNFGAEFSDVSTNGATYLRGFAINLQRNSPTASVGLLEEGMERWGGQTGAMPANVGLQVTDDSGLFPLSSTSTFQQIGGDTNNSYTIKTGTVYGVNVSGNVLQWKNGAYYLAGSGSASLLTVKLTVFAVGSLPVCNTGAEGTVSTVSDGSTGTFNAVLGGGGTHHVMAYCNGTNWTVH